MEAQYNWHTEKPVPDGMPKVLERLERAICKSHYLRGRFYEPWLSLTEKDRQGFRRSVRTIVVEELLGAGFKQAIARTLIDDEGRVQVTSPLYTFLLAKVFAGNSRSFLTSLKTWGQQ